MWWLRVVSVLRSTTVGRQVALRSIPGRLDLMWLRVISVFLVPVALAAASGTALAQKKKPSGRALYLEKCAVCHGDEGGGDGPGAKTMLPRPRVFADNSDFKF